MRDGDNVKPRETLCRVIERTLDPTHEMTTRFKTYIINKVQNMQLVTSEMVEI